MIVRETCGGVRGRDAHTYMYGSLYVHMWVHFLALALGLGLQLYDNLKSVLGALGVVAVPASLILRIWILFFEKFLAHHVSCALGTPRGMLGFANWSGWSHSW